MLHILKILFLLVIFGIFSACTSMKTSSDAKKDKSIKIAEINIQLGMGYLEKGNIERAKQKLLTALKKAPKLPEAWYSMAYFLEHTGEKEAAKRYYLKAVALAPERGDTQNNYGTYLCRSGHYQESIQHFILATKDPDYLDTVGAYENAGLCALKIPDTNLAIKYFKQALTQDPGRTTSLMELKKLEKPRGT